MCGTVRTPNIQKAKSVYVEMIPKTGIMGPVTPPITAFGATGAPVTTLLEVAVQHATSRARIVWTMGRPPAKAGNTTQEVSFGAPVAITRMGILGVPDAPTLIARTAPPRMILTTWKKGNASHAKLATISSMVFAPPARGCPTETTIALAPALGVVEVEIALPSIAWSIALIAPRIKRRVMCLTSNGSTTETWVQAT
jgi:hypothetical protein